MLTRCISRSEIPSKNAPNIWEMVIGQLIHGLGATDFFFFLFLKKTLLLDIPVKIKLTRKIP